MREQFHLPPELTDIEAKLRQAPLPASRINRDALFYDAGWAAAEALSARGSSRRFWPLASGVLAATVVILAGLLVLPSSNDRELVLVTPTAPAPAEASMSFPGPTPSLAVSPLLAKRERALRGDFGADPSTEVSLASAPGSGAKSAHELMRQLLPEAERIDSTTSPLLPTWLWRPFVEGQSI